MGIYMKFGNIVGDATQNVMNISADTQQHDNREELKKLDGGLRSLVGDTITGVLLGETGWIPLHSFDWHADRSITTRAGKGSPSQTRGPVAPNLDDITVEKEVDGSSKGLLEKFDTDKDGVDCTIVFVRTGDPGEVYLKYALKNTLISDIRVNAKRDDRPTETLILNFTDIEFTVWRVGEDNIARAPFRYPMKKSATQQSGGQPNHGGGQGHHQHH
jgi:type VI secretion system secreted protein Hcp